MKKIYLFSFKITNYQYRKHFGRHTYRKYLSYFHWFFSTQFPGLVLIHVCSAPYLALEVTTISLRVWRDNYIREKRESKYY